MGGRGAVAAIEEETEEEEREKPKARHIAGGLEAEGKAKEAVGVRLTDCASAAECDGTAVGRSKVGAALGRGKTVRRSVGLQARVMWPG